MPYIGPLNTSEGARKSDFDFDYLSQHPNGRAAPSGGLPVYKQFPRVLKPIMTKVAEMAARWRCEHTFTDSGRTAFSRFLT